MSALGQQGARGPMGTTGRHSGASQQVLEYLRTQPNITVSHSEIMKAIGAKHPHTVSNAVTHLIAKGLPVERPLTGMAIYRTTPKAVEAPTKVFTNPREIFEQVGISQGRIIVRGEDSELYVLSPLWGANAPS